MSNDLGLGKLITTPQQRDAIHVAVIPLVAGDDLSKGQEFRLAYGTSNVAIASERAYGCEAIGIVDPFLDEYRVEKGQQFWGFLFPGTVASLRHHWEHPAFDNVKKSTNESEVWLRIFADRWNIKWDDICDLAAGKTDYITARGIDLHYASDLDNGSADEELFFEHLANHFGVNAKERLNGENIWNCSC